MVFTMKPIGALVILITTFLAPISMIFHGMLALISLDLITGIMAYFKKDKLKFSFFKAEAWRHITSKKLGQTLQKTLVYMILIITGFIIDTLILPGITNLLITKIMAGAVALRELKSLIENGEIILGGGIISFIKSVAKNGFAGALKTLGDDE